MHFLVILKFAPIFLATRPSDSSPKTPENLAPIFPPLAAPGSALTSYGPAAIRSQVPDLTLSWRMVDLNGNFMGIHGDFMGISWEFMGISWDLGIFRQGFHQKKHGNSHPFTLWKS